MKQIIDYSMRKILTALFCYLTLSCGELKKAFEQKVVHEYTILRSGNLTYILREKKGSNGTIEYSIWCNRQRFGPYIKLDRDGKVLEKRIFWKERLYAGKKYHWTNNRLDSISFSTYNKFFNNQYQKNSHFSSKTRPGFFKLTFPIFSCDEQITKLSVSGYDHVIIFPGLETAADEYSYKTEQFYVLDGDAENLYIINKDTSNVKYALDFAYDTNDPDTINSCSALFVHPTIVIECSSISEDFKKEILSKKFVF